MTNEDSNLLSRPNHTMQMPAIIPEATIESGAEDLINHHEKRKLSKTTGTMGVVGYPDNTQNSFVFKGGQTSNIDEGPPTTESVTSGTTNNEPMAKRGRATVTGHTRGIGSMMKEEAKSSVAQHKETVKEFEMMIYSLKGKVSELTDSVKDLEAENDVKGERVQAQDSELYAKR